MTFGVIFEDWPKISIALLILIIIIVLEITWILYKWFYFNPRSQPQRQTSDDNELWLKTPEIEEFIDEQSLHEEIIIIDSEEEQPKSEETINELIEILKEEGKQSDNPEEPEVSPIETQPLEETDVLDFSEEEITQNQETTVAIIESSEQTEIKTFEEEVQSIPTSEVSTLPIQDVKNEEPNEVTVQMVNERLLLENTILEKSFELIEEMYPNYSGLKNAYLLEYNLSKNGRINWKQVFSGLSLHITCLGSALEWIGQIIANINSRKKLDIYLMVDRLIELSIKENENCSEYKNNNFFEQFNMIKSWQYFRRQ